MSVTIKYNFANGVNGIKEISSVTNNTLNFTNIFGNTVARNITTIDITGIETLNINNLYYLMQPWLASGSEMYSLTDITNLSFTNNVTHMEGLFRGCSNLINIPNFNTSKINNMWCMFYECKNLENIPNLDFSNVTQVPHAFLGCSRLSNIPVFNISNIKTVGLAGTFAYCYNLTDLKLNGVTDVNTGKNTFIECRNLKRMENICFTNLSYAPNMFRYCTNITDISNITLATDTDYDSDYSLMFAECENLVNLSINSNLTPVWNNSIYMRGMFTNCNNLSNQSLLNIANMLPDVQYAYFFRLE